jgi:hypothetical protein
LATNEELQSAFVTSCRSYWTTRDSQALTGGGEGLAAAVRAGKHFASLEDLVQSVFIDCGYTPKNFVRNRSANLPGYYRSTKTWDLIVRDGDILVAALELKGLGAKSAGNNFNNRTEEALGNATDLWLVNEKHAPFGAIRPWCGFMFLLEDSPVTRRPIGEMPSKWPVDPIFAGSSYLRRGAILSKRMLDERLYDAVCYVTSSADPQQAPTEPLPELSWMAFVTAIQARVAYIQQLQSRTAIVASPPYVAHDDMLWAADAPPAAFERRPLIPEDPASP